MSKQTVVYCPMCNKINPITEEDFANDLFFCPNCEIYLSPRQLSSFTFKDLIKKNTVTINVTEHDQRPMIIVNCNHRR